MQLTQGVLVEALRNGYWIVLDELNLAPSDVLEALNRLLDDNRELYIPETQEVVKPHPQFMLFATQNPAGEYAGRKQLSRAFRNRFVELHFGDIPAPELEIILEQKCKIPPTYAKKLTGIYSQLQSTRDTSRIFDKHVITLRDLFRWALRRAESYTQLAQDGYMLLAERTRKPEERETIQQILETSLRAKIDMETYYATKFQEVMTTLAGLGLSVVDELISKVVWTSSMQKLFVLVYNATMHNEPVLLIGDTGCGKTTVCQILAGLVGRHLHIVNAHQNSETADFLGSQRPNRNREGFEAELVTEVNNVLEGAGKDVLMSSSLEKLEITISDLKGAGVEADYVSLETLMMKAKSLFEWHDGPLVHAMRQGDYFLLDEISLADDSVLERFNSVLEPHRLLVLVENGTVEEITAHPSFHFLATMNPGGDYGKKELSPALRNRFTEIWVPSISSRTDLLMIVSNRLAFEESQIIAAKIVDFIEWFAEKLYKPLESIVSLRDILAWANFIVANQAVGINIAFFHGGSMVLIDGLGVNPLFGTVGATSGLAVTSRAKLAEIAGLPLSAEFDEIADFESKSRFGLAPFFIPVGSSAPRPVSFTMHASTTKKNCMRVLRAMQLSKPVLLEGSPGVGKTSLVSSLAAVARHELVRINLSEQTDLMDLFGSDLPVEGRTAEFAWRDGMRFTKYRSIPSSHAKGSLGAFGRT
jgi:midasin